MSGVGSQQASSSSKRKLVINKQTFESLQMQRNLSKTSHDKKVSMFQLVYNNGTSQKWAKRPAYFSFIRILSYKELQLLAVLSTLEQSATFLSLDCD